MPTFFRIKIFRSWVLSLSISLLTVSSSAATLSDYQTRLERAHSYAEALIDVAAAEDMANEHSLLSRIRVSIPASERVDFVGGTLETRNQWLHELLKEYSLEADSDERVAIATRLGERLLAISEAVQEAATASNGVISKDENKQKLAEILRRPEYQKAAPAEPSLFQRALDEILRLVAKMFPNAPLGSGTPSSFAAMRIGLQILIYALVIALVSLLIYKFSPYFLRSMRARRSIEGDSRVILGHEMAADESAADLFRNAEALARQGDLRAAIRMGYIAALCTLGERNAIRIVHHKTNRDYLSEIRPDAHLYDAMSDLTRRFEVSWYGLRPATDEEWQGFRDRYLKWPGAAKA